MKVKIVFFGSSKYVIPIIEVLKRDFDLALVVTTERNSSDPIPSYCLSQKIPHLSVSILSDSTLNSQLSILNSQLAVLADFGLIIPKEILSSFPKGIINIHPSLLPKYRGPTPVQNAILNGDEKTGVSIIRLDEKIDHGPILAQTKESIFETDTSESLYRRLFNLGAHLLPKILTEYLNGNLTPQAQNHKKATFTKPLTRADGYIDISYNKLSKEKLEIARKIRAFYPWPGVWTKLNLKTKDQKPKTIKLLPKNLIQVEGKKPMSYKDFLNGYPEIKNLILSETIRLQMN